MTKQGKKLRAAYTTFDRKQEFNIVDAIAMVKKVAPEKFDPTIEVSLNLNLNTTLADQQLRGALILPNGTGKVSKVLVIADLEEESNAKNAGADFFGGEEMLKKIEKDNWFAFDFIITTPKMMPKFAKFGKLLGPKGLMPNPKLGTVTNDIAKAVENIKKGQIEYRTDKQGIINLPIGKKSFTDEQLIQNYNAVYQLIKSLRPASLKGTYLHSVTISSSMGPGVKVKFE